MKRYFNILVIFSTIVLCVSCQRSVPHEKITQCDKSITEHQWSSSLVGDFAYLQMLIESPDKWTDEGTGKAVKQECVIYQHQTEPVKIWIDRQRGILLRSECGMGDRRVLIQTSTLKKIDGAWIFESVKLRKLSTDETVVLNSKQGNSLALTSAWTLRGKTPVD